MPLLSNNNSTLSFRSSTLSSLNGLSRHSAFRSHAQLPPSWQSISLTELVIGDLNQKLKGRLNENQLAKFDESFPLYFSVERDVTAQQKLTKGLELQLVELECQARQVELKLHITGALFSWAGLKWVDEWPVSHNMDRDHLYVQVSSGKNFVFKSRHMLEPITIEIPGGISEEQQEEYRQGRSDCVLLDALQAVRNLHIQSIVLNRAELESLVDTQMDKILLSFTDTTDAHASATPSAERQRRSTLLKTRLQESREQLVSQLLDMPASHRLAYLSEMEMVSQQIDAERVEQAMRYANYEARVNDTQQAVVGSPQLARCPQTELMAVAERLAKESINLKRFDEDQTLLDKVIVLKDAHWLKMVLAYADHVDSSVPIEQGGAVHIEPFSPLGLSTKDKPLVSSLFAEDHPMRSGLWIDTSHLGSSCSSSSNTGVKKLCDPRPLDPQPLVKPWLIACALQGVNFDGALRACAQHGCLFDPALMQEVCAVAPEARKDFFQARLVTDLMGGGESPCGMPISNDGSVDSLDLSAVMPTLLQVSLAELLDEDYHIKSKHLSTLLYPAKEGLSDAFIAELMRRYVPLTLWPNEIWQAIQARQVYNIREKEHFDILTQHCHESLSYLTRQYLAHSGGSNQAWHEQKLKTELTLISDAYKGQSHQSAPVDIYASLSQDPCLRARKSCVPSNTLSLIPRTSPATVSEVATLEQPWTLAEAKALLESLKLSADDRQKQAKKYCLAKQVFKRTLRYLDHTEVDKSTKKDALLTLCDRFSKGEISGADGLLGELTRPDSPVRGVLHARRDQQAKPARSFGWAEYDLLKRGELLNHENLLQAI